MNAIKAICVLICIGLIAGCASIYGIKYDYDPQTDFSKYKTYDWMAVPVKANMNEFVVERVKNAVDAELGAKGLKRDSQHPDFLIAEHLMKKDTVEINEWGYDYGPYWDEWRTDHEISSSSYEEGMLILDFVDAGTKKLLWRGSAKSDIQWVDTPQKSESLINKAVQKILQKYPPTSAS